MIVSVTPINAHIVVTDKEDCPSYTRYGPDSWTVSMGESEEQVYECAELESEFQKFIATRHLTSLNPDLPSQHDSAV